MSRVVYFIKPIGMDGPVKIGCSEHPPGRVETFMPWSPFPLEIAVTIPGAFDLERNIQECFCDQRSHLEWFYPSPRLTALIGALKRGALISDVLDLSDRRGRMAPQYSAEDRRYFRYTHKISRLTQKYRDDGFVLNPSKSVQEIMERWNGGLKRKGVPRVRQAPSGEDIAFLDAALAEPLSSCRGT